MFTLVCLIDISNAKQESTELLKQLTSSRAVLAGFKILCSNCQNQVLKKVCLPKYSVYHAILFNLLILLLIHS